MTFEDNVTQINELIAKYPKRFSQELKKNIELFKLVDSAIGSSIAEKAYNYLTHNSESVCKLGNTKTFNSISTGYKFCGSTNKCACAKAAVSQKVKDTVSLKTIEEKTATNVKRTATLIESYGVTNAGQLSTSKANHTAFYENTNNVETVSSKIKATKKLLHGSENWNNIEQIKATFKEKCTTEYWATRFNNQNYFVLNDASQLKTLYETLSVDEIADKLDVHKQTVYRYLNQHSIRVQYRSSEELEVVRFLTELGITRIVTNSRSILPSRKELDIYLPDYNLAIEYNGVYWHHEDIPHITKTYHMDKFKECQSLGIQLITVFSNFWNYKKDIVKRTIQNKLGLSTNSIAGRKCQVEEVNTATAREFLNSNHVQGYTTSSNNYGLFYNTELVALMTFGKSRVGIGKQEDGYELIRFASSKRVAGGASKLLSHFVKLHAPSKIVSYSDNEWSNGNLYAALNFTLEKEIPPSYWYLLPRTEQLMHRFNFAKHKLVEKGFDLSLTEREITKQMGLMKIWDCGKLRWVKQY